MLLYEERKKIIEICLKMKKKNLTNGTSGNVSIFNRELNIVAITPTGEPYDTLVPNDISIVNLSGELLEGKKPTTELEMHLINYRNRSDISAIIHAHTIYATTMSCLRKTLPAIDYMIAIGGDKDVLCAKYATYGSLELAENAYISMKDRYAVLLANHGINTAGQSIEQAYNILVQIEYVAQLYILSSQIGNPVILDDNEMKKIVTRFKNYSRT